MTGTPLTDCSPSTGIPLISGVFYSLGLDYPSRNMAENSSQDDSV